MNRLLVLAACLAVGLNTSPEKKQSVELTVFYESYCPFSIDFIEHLHGAWHHFQPHLNVDLVPYGNGHHTYSDGHFVFTCQHGAKECVGNILHSCAIYEACGNEGTLPCPSVQLKKALDYIHCIIQQRNQEKASDQCATKSGLVPEEINKCANGRLGEWLVSGHGNRTSTFNQPRITYMPFIVINGKHTEKIQDEAEKNLKALICKYIPDQCKK